MGQGMIRNFLRKGHAVTVSQPHARARALEAKAQLISTPRRRWRRGGRVFDAHQRRASRECWTGVGRVRRGPPAGTLVTEFDAVERLDPRLGRLAGQGTCGSSIARWPGGRTWRQPGRWRFRRRRSAGYWKRCARCSPRSAEVTHFGPVGTDSAFKYHNMLGAVQVAALAGHVRLRVAGSTSWRRLKPSRPAPARIVRHSGYVARRARTVSSPVATASGHRLRRGVRREDRRAVCNRPCRAGRFRADEPARHGQSERRTDRCAAQE